MPRRLFGPTALFNLDASLSKDVTPQTFGQTAGPVKDTTAPRRPREPPAREAVPIVRGRQPGQEGGIGSGGLVELSGVFRHSGTTGRGGPSNLRSTANGSPDLVR